MAIELWLQPFDKLWNTCSLLSLLPFWHPFGATRSTSWGICSSARITHKASNSLDETHRSIHIDVETTEICIELIPSEKCYKIIAATILATKSYNFHFVIPPMLSVVRTDRIDILCWKRWVMQPHATLGVCQTDCMDSYTFWPEVDFHMENPIQAVWNGNQGFVCFHCYHFAQQAEKFAHMQASPTRPAIHLMQHTDVETTEIPYIFLNLHRINSRYKLLQNHCYNHLIYKNIQLSFWLPHADLPKTHCCVSCRTSQWFHPWKLVLCMRQSRTHPWSVGATLACLAVQLTISAWWWTSACGRPCRMHQMLVDACTWEKAAKKCSGGVA